MQGLGLGVQAECCLEGKSMFMKMIHEDSIGFQISGSACRTLNQNPKLLIIRFFDLHRGFKDFAV